MGRPISDLVAIYTEHSTRKLSSYLTVEDGVYVSIFQGLTLREYVCARREYCSCQHKQCVECPKMLLVAEIVLNNGCVKLKSAFLEAFPSVKYVQQHSRRRLLPMPLACVRIDYRPGQSECFLIEHNEAVDYRNFAEILRNLIPRTATTSVDRGVVKSMLGLCQTDRERELLRCAVVKSAGLSATQARKQLGFGSMSQRMTRLNEVIKHAEYIRGSVEKLASIKERAVLRSLGINCNSNDDTSGSSSDDDCDEAVEMLDVSDGYDSFTSLEDRTTFVTNCEFNWFEVSERTQRVHGDRSTEVLQKLVDSIDQLKISTKEKEKIKISREAFILDEQASENLHRHVNVLNGDIVTDSDEDDDPDLIQGAKTPVDLSLREVVLRKRKSIKRRMQRLKAKRVTEQNFLRRRSSKRLDSIVNQYPNIGETIEDFVKVNNIGADAWRRTGVLTFDGNISASQKVT